MKKVALPAVVKTAAGTDSGRPPKATAPLHGRALHRLTERSPEFFDETVGRHLESLETELEALQGEAAKRAGEIERIPVRQ